MVFGLTYLQAAGIALIALLVIRVLFGDNVKSVFQKKPESLLSYDYQGLANALKVLHDHVDLVGEDEEIEALDSLAKLILRNTEAVDEK